jgi:hypothetical protein
MGHEPETGEYVTSLRVCNSRSIALTFCLEPWGEQYSMAPEAIFDVVARGPKGDSLEVEFSDDRIVLYGWPGSIVTVFHKGTELGVGCLERTPVPSTPPIERR